MTRARVQRYLFLASMVLVIVLVWPNPVIVLLVGMLIGIELQWLP